MPLQSTNDLPSANAVEFGTVVTASIELSIHLNDNALENTITQSPIRSEIWVSNTGQFKNKPVLLKLEGSTSLT